MQKQFEEFRASELHCSKCGVLRPVRERLLLVLPFGELYACCCVACGETLGTREVREQPRGIVRP